MSRENIRRFNEFMALNVEAQKELNARIAAATLEFAAEKGFEFTAEDHAELSDEDLDKVNGGSILRECWEDLLEEWKNH